ncbi:hypothetical protein BJ322DRAFT_1213065 [Thelephora terrestris]|uniref:alpha,alpha-trehalase n=1 Tax=Thelephora terrestris TaxID=56493 RepID=A0A9P6L4G0_9AGAM|nr:hypothetical protein BJ322DRAFT_1213065 [Thelephora terrestris]
MLDHYINATNDTSILERALPLAELELEWWPTNRSITVTSPYTSQTYNMFHHAVDNSASRLESYLEDYQAMTGVKLTRQQRSDLYAELATGAEPVMLQPHLVTLAKFLSDRVSLGWDYTGRWLKQPLAGNNLTDQDSKLRKLNIRSTIPTSLTRSSPGPSIRRTPPPRALNLSGGILDLFWDSNTLAFYDYNLTPNTRNGYHSPTFYPFCVGIILPEVLNDESKAFGAFAPSTWF